MHILIPHATSILGTNLVCLDPGPDSESGSADPKNKSGYNQDADLNPDLKHFKKPGGCGKHGV